MNLRIATYNIFHGEDHPKRLAGERVIDLKKTAEAIRQTGAVLCGLNEVRSQQGEGLCNQAQAIGEALGWNYLFCPAIPIANGEYGNALVSKFPIISYTLHPIRTTPEMRVNGAHFEDRVLGEICIDIDRTAVTVLVCHFGLNDVEQRLATELVLLRAAEIKTPLIFMGDLNLLPNHEYIEKIASVLTDTASVSDDPLLTFPAYGADRKIDYIFVNDKCKVCGTHVPNIGVSDHLPVVADLEI